jgi:branched-chain amino acid transport system permease protein
VASAAVGLVRQHASRYWRGTALVIVALIAPFVAGEYSVYLLNAVIIYSLVVIGLNVLLGYSGQVSLGHAAFLALGAYTIAIVTDRLGLPFMLSLIMAATLAGAVGWLLGWAATRLSGHYLAVATLGFAIIVQKALYELSWLTGGRNGMAVPPMSLFGLSLSDTRTQYWFALVAVVLAFIFTSAVVNSRVGRAWIALKNSDVAASACGVDVARYRVKAFVLSAVLTGVAGGLFAPHITFLSADSFNLALSIAFLTAVVLGGMGSVIGSILGAAFLVILPQVLADYAELQEVLYGVAIVLVILLLPRGLVQLAEFVRGRDAHRTSSVVGADEAAPEIEAWKAPETWAAGRAAQLSVEDVSIAFNGVQALQDLSFNVRPGEILGLMGPNGAGKTTLFNIISGYYRPDAGHVRYGDEDLTGRPTHKLRSLGIARSFQQALLFEDLTVRDNLLVGAHVQYNFGLTATGLRIPATRAQERQVRSEAEAVLALLGLDHRADTVTRDLPFGERKLVDFGRTLMGGPALLVLDEPSAGMNSAETARLRQVLERVRGATGCSVLIIEHDMNLIMSLCDRIVVVDFGKLIMVGTPDEVRHDPRVIEAYLGEEIDATH